MKIEKYVCDMCGKEIPKTEERMIISVCDSYAGEKFDTCCECGMKFKRQLEVTKNERD